MKEERIGPALYWGMGSAKDGEFVSYHKEKAGLQEHRILRGGIGDTGGTAKTHIF